jgi:hypothetical protein
MNTFNERNEYINTLCEWIEEVTAELRMFPGYINDALDVDREGCFV